MEIFTYLLLPILIALVITAQTASTLSDLIGKASKVIDGDTIIVKPKIGKKIEVRLDMVDTPEIGQTGYHEARAFTKELCLGKPVRVDVDDIRDKDHYGRTLGQVYCQGQLLDRLLIDKGLAEFISTSHCSSSEFQMVSWVIRYCHPELVN